MGFFNSKAKETAPATEAPPAAPWQAPRATAGEGPVPAGAGKQGAETTPEAAPTQAPPVSVAAEPAGPGINFDTALLDVFKKEEVLLDKATSSLADEMEPTEAEELVGLVRAVAVGLGLPAPVNEQR